MNSHQELELELAWLVKKLPNNLFKYKHTQIKQGYLPDSRDKVKDVRIREKEGKYTHTIKYFVKSSQETGNTREVTKKLTKTEFVEFWKRAEKKTKKIRYYYPLPVDIIAEVDIYKDNLDGLIVVEVEFPDISSYKNFKKPKWFGKEVTDSKGIYPPHIAGMTIEQINKINDKYTQKPHEFE